MALTAEQRAEISRKNGAQSRGPKTEAGKRIASMNALQHGLCSRATVLPNEDPDAVAALRDQWHYDVQPQTAAEHFLVEECVHAHLMAQRFHRAHGSAVARQLEQITAAWENQRRKRLQALRVRLEDDPAGIVAELARFGHGCRWLIARWERLQQALEARGYWMAAERDEAIRLFGGRPERERLCEDEEMYCLYLFCVRSQPGMPAEVIEALLHPDLLPAAFRTYARTTLLFDMEKMRAALTKKVADELDALRAEEQRLRTGPEAEELARAQALASLLEDADEARRLLRYHAEYRSSFHRAHNALRALQKRESAQEREESRGVADQEEWRGSVEGTGTTSADRSDAPAGVGDAPAAAAGCIVDDDTGAGAGPGAPQGAEGPADAVEAGPRNEPGIEAQVPEEEQVDPSAGAAEAGPRDEPGAVAVEAVAARPRDEPGPGASATVTPALRNEPVREIVATTTTTELVPGHSTESPAGEPIAPDPGGTAAVAPGPGPDPGPDPGTNPALGRGGIALPGQGGDRGAWRTDPLGRPLRVDRGGDPSRLWDLEDLPLDQGGGRRRTAAMEAQDGGPAARRT